MGILNIKGLGVWFSERCILNDIDLEVHEGEILSIIGPNGSGKSTLLRVMSRLLVPDRGEVLLDGDDIAKMHPKTLARKVATLLQINTSPEDITVRDLIHYGRLPHKKWYEGRNEEDYQKVTEALRRTFLLAFENKPISKLSGGEKQRVWLALALAQEPKVLLLDEPTTYLD